jgi:glyoxylate/hydroxypyruvate reductase
MGLGVLGERVAKALRCSTFRCTAGAARPRPSKGVVPQRRGRFRRLPVELPRAGEPAAADARHRDILNRRTLGRPAARRLPDQRGARRAPGGDDLLALLDSGHLAGATLDVFRTEPLPAEHPFWTHPKITVTPHTSARTLRDESIAQIAGKIRALERGEPWPAWWTGAATEPETHP